MFIDSHAHLFAGEFGADLTDVIRRASDEGVTEIICPGTDLETSRRAIDLAERFDAVYACVGFHPHDASGASPEALESIEALSEHPRVVGIGEIGLDYHYNFSPPASQREVFARQIDIAIRRNLPIVIHCREAEEDLLNIVGETLPKPWGRPESKGVFHCFPGDHAMAEQVISWGFRISIPGPVTFGKKAGKPHPMTGVVARVSPENILLETDSPFLAPVPHRGKRNEPAYLPIIAGKIAELQGRTVGEIAAATTAACRRLFRLVPGNAVPPPRS